MMEKEKYFALFFLILPGKTARNMNEQAFEELEKIHYEEYGCNRYKNYSAFKMAKTRHIAKMVSKKVTK